MMIKLSIFGTNDWVALQRNKAVIPDSKQCFVEVFFTVTIGGRIIRRRSCPLLVMAETGDAAAGAGDAVGAVYAANPALFLL
jgi:hypothetical protein